ncbi:MAG: porin family protein [Holosporaceae bacterium]|jgi:hypothetical protein|nr:porin family protein [Holosporaceae bacterium]
MKKNAVCALLALCCNTFADNLPKKSAEDSAESLPVSGFYLGLGLKNCEDYVEWSIERHIFGDDSGYIKDAFSSNAKHFNGEIFVGYRNFDYFFWAIELNLSFDKRDSGKLWPHDTIGWPVPANLRIKNGNDLSFLAKLGKTIGGSTTPYILLGFHYRKIGFDLDYAPTLPDNYPNEAEYLGYLRSGSSYSRHVTGFVYGFGIAHSIDPKTEVRLEYCCKVHGSVKYSTTVDNLVDEPGSPRTFHLKNKQYCVSLCISRTISLP